MATVFRARENNAHGLLDSGIDNATLTITLGSGEGARFPASGTFWIKITTDPADFTDEGERIEIESRAGDVLTAASGGRGSEGTVAQEWDPDTFVLIVTAKADFTEITDAINDIEDGTTVLDSLTVAGATVLNESGGDNDTRIEGVGEVNALFVQGSDGFVGLGTASPTAPLTITSEGTDGEKISIFGSGSGSYGMALGAGEMRIYAGTGGDIRFLVGGAAGTTLLLLDADGSVLIGGGFGSSGVTITGTGAISADGALTVDNTATIVGAVTTDAHINIAEISTPTPVADYGALYTKDDNFLYFQDGAGVEHKLESLIDSYSQLWDNHGADGSTTLDITMANQNEWYKVTGYQNIGEEDPDSNAVASLTTDDITLAVGAGGKYDLAFHGSANVSGGATQELAFAIGITLATPKAITDATNTDPIVVTRVGHGLRNGDMVTISGVVGNTAANTDCIVTNIAPDTFEMVDLAGATIAGNGAYVSDGTIDIIFPGCAHIHVAIAISDLVPISASCRIPVFDSDVAALYVANQTSAAKDAQFSSVDFGISREAD